MNTLGKTGVSNKVSGDSLSHQDVNNINSTVNLNVDATNYLLKNFCNVNDEINDYSKIFSLEEAINQVPVNRRKPGMKIRFLDSSNIYREFIYMKSNTNQEDWINKANWMPDGVDIIDGGEW